MSTTNFSRKHSVGYGSHEKQLQDLTRKTVAATSFPDDMVLDEVLPGIPSRGWTPSPASPPRAKREPGRHKSVELARPGVARSHSVQDDAMAPANVVVNGQTRTRTRTLDDARRHVHSSSNASRNTQPTIAESNGADGLDRDVAALAIGYPSTVPFNPSTPPPPPPSSSSAVRPESGARPTSSQRPPSSGSRTMVQPDHPRPFQSSIGRDRRTSISTALSRKIKHLMSITRGHMQGPVLLSTAESPEWIPAYCAINPATGSLLKETAGGDAAEEPLVSNIRGCQVAATINQKTRMTTLHLQVKVQPYDIYFRPANPADVYKWQAALLCWQVVEHDETLMSDSQISDLIPSVRIPKEEDGTRDRNVAGNRENSICKVRKLKMWNPGDHQKPKTGDSSQTQDDDVWTTVSCMLRHNGDLGIYTDPDVQTIAVIPMSSLSRSAVQRLSPSVLGVQYCIAIYPEYSRLSKARSRLRPLFLSCENKVLFEVWFVLLRAFATPELYGPPRNSSTDLLPSEENLPGLVASRAPSVFRIERTPEVQICDYREKRDPPRPRTEGSGNDEDLSLRTALFDEYEYHVQILVDGHLRARTRRRTGPSEVRWFETLRLLDIPTTASFVSFRIVQTSAASSLLSTEDAGQPKSGVDRSKQPPPSVRPPQTPEQMIGETTVSIEELGSHAATGNRLLLYDDAGNNVGTLGIKSRIDQDLILTDNEYSVISDLLHSFSNSLTMDLADRMPQELTRLAIHLLDIFQVSGQASEWLMTLAEEEIDGIRKEKPTLQHRFQNSLSSNESKEHLPAYGPNNERSEVVRDINRSAAAEANLLFRGNTLLSKALDIHMQRLGKDYLEETIGPKVREIIELAPDMEVDPSKLSATACLPYNHVRLLETTENMWQLIKQSASRCPAELRSLFRHVRACAEDRFGDRLRNAPYTAVSGFLFLRFFCPAILNPALFGLTDGKHPDYQPEVLY